MVAEFAATAKSVASRTLLPMRRSLAMSAMDTTAPIIALSPVPHGTRFINSSVRLRWWRRAKRGARSNRGVIGRGARSKATKRCEYCALE